MNKWDTRFIGMAKLVSTWSKDPSTKVGAVIVRPDRTVVSLGFNGFPRGVTDLASRLEDRDTKYEFMVHGEMNAILHAKEPLKDCTLYTYPFLTCNRCAVHVVQSGIKSVVAPYCPEELKERWDVSFMRARIIYLEAGVNVYEGSFNV